MHITSKCKHYKCNAVRIIANRIYLANEESAISSQRLSVPCPDGTWALWLS